MKALARSRYEAATSGSAETIRSPAACGGSPSRQAIPLGISQGYRDWRDYKGRNSESVFRVFKGRRQGVNPGGQPIDSRKDGGYASAIPPSLLSRRGRGPRDLLRRSGASVEDDEEGLWERQIRTLNLAPVSARSHNPSPTSHRREAASAPVYSPRPGEGGAPHPAMKHFQLRKRVIGCGPRFLRSRPRVRRRGCPAQGRA